MKLREHMNEMRRKAEEDGLHWQNWFCDEANLRKHIEMRLGTGSLIEIEDGYATTVAFPVVGSDQQFCVAIFVRPIQGGWHATERVLVPDL